MKAEVTVAGLVALSVRMRADGDAHAEAMVRVGDEEVCVAFPLEALVLTSQKMRPHARVIIVSEEF